MKYIFTKNCNIFIISLVAISMIIYSPTLERISLVFGYGGDGAVFYSSAKSITDFTVIDQVGVAIINENDHTVTLTMLADADINNLAPIIKITGTSINPASGVALNFTNPQIYNVTAANGSTQNYTVTVNVAPAITVIDQETNWFINKVKRTDIIRDGVIDVLDFNGLMVNWSKKDQGNIADVNQDGIVDIFDFNLVMVYWGQVEIIT